MRRVRLEEMRVGFDRAYAVLLRIYPADFRNRFGSEMVEAFRDSCRQVRKRDGRTALAIHGMRALAELAAHGVTERCERAKRAMRDRAHGTNGTQPGTDLGSNARRSSMFCAFAAECQHACRSLVKQPVFLLVSGITLALGLGANTAVFSVFNSVVLNPLPYDEPDRLVRIYTATDTDPARTGYLSGYDFPFMRDEIGGFETAAVMFTYRETGKNFADDGGAQRLRTLHVSSGYFETYRATPLFGRTFARNEESDDANLVVLSHDLWRAHTNEDANIVGKTIALDDELYTVVGVMRPTYRDIVGGDVDMWLPLDLRDGGWNSPGNQYLTGIARLAPGTTLDQVQAQVDAFQQRLSEELPDSYGDQITRLVPLRADAVGGTGSVLFLLWGAAILVLLVACVNVANLSFARSVAHTKEIAVRVALGSGRGRLVTRFLNESLIVATFGGIAGTFLAYCGVQGLLSVSPESIPRAEEVSFDAALFGLSFVATVITGLLFGVAPAIRSANVAPNETLRDDTRGNTGSRKGRAIRSILVAAQISIACILLIGTGLLVRSFVALRSVDLGVNPQNVSTFEIHLPNTTYAEGEDRSSFHKLLLGRLRAHSNIEAAGATSWLPANGRYHSWSFGFEKGIGETERVLAQVRTVEGDYFDVLGIDVRAGRVFDQVDRLDTTPVALINERFSSRAFGNEYPIGKLIRSGSGDYTVVGVVSNVSHETRGSLDNRVYLSHSQMSGDRNWSMKYILKTTAAGSDVIDYARRELLTIDGTLVVHNPSTLRRVLGGQLSRDRFVLALLAIFACIALSLAAVGTYGVLSYSVNQRIHEIGIRMALGAKPSQVRMIIVGQTVAVTCLGLGIGLTGAFCFSRLMHSLVFGVSVTDPLVFATVPVVLATVAAIATVVPMFKATRVNPVYALAND